MWPRGTTLLLAAGLCAVPAARAQTGLRNADFEEGPVGQLPPGWSVPTAGYTAVTTDVRAHHGQHCARLSSDQTQDQAPFGNLMQSIDATPFRGQRVRLKAAVRLVMGGFDDKTQLWLRVDRADGQVGFFDNMGERPIRNVRWEYYEIVGDVADDAQSVNLGLILMRNGQVWLDDVALEIIGPAPTTQMQGPRPLTGRALDNLVAFTRLLGYVRFFHPSRETAEVDWESFAIRGVQAIEDAQDAAELAGRLEQIFRPIAPTVRVFPTGEQPPMPAGLAPPKDADALGITTWRHRGVQLGPQSKVYRSHRAQEMALNGDVPKGMPDPAEPFVAELGGGVSGLVPLALWMNRAGTLPWADRTETAATASAPTVQSGDNRATRLADIALAWNVFQHFYPYFDVVETDWAAVLRTALTSAATDADQRAFLDTLRRMIAELHDGHGNVHHESDVRPATLPLLWDWVAGQLVVTHVDESVGVGQLQPGDIVVEIDGRDAADVLAAAEQFISAATPQWKRHRGLQEIARGAADEEVTLKIAAADGQTRTVTLSRSIRPEPLREPRPEKVAELRPGIMYVDLDRCPDEDFEQALPRLEQARGIVFDLRGYPSKLSTVVIAHLIDEPVTSAQWLVPKVTRPDREQMEYHSSNWTVTPLKPRLTGKVAFVTDGRAISYAETYLGIIEHYRLAEIVGGPTAGTNGNVNPFTLPGGYRVTWTGMRVLKHDGSRHHGVGIRPTAPVARTIAGIRAGRDELLERAIEVVSP